MKRDDLQYYTKKYCLNLPAIVGRMLKRNKHSADESNCWNTTLKVLGVKVPYRWEEGVDMQRWLDKNTYRLKKGEKPRKGDIVWFGFHSRIEHTALYLGICQEAGHLGELLIFHKMGPDPFEFSTVEEVLRDWEWLDHHFLRRVGEQNDKRREK